MSNIDERILEMKFDNHLFDKNIETSIKSLEKLKTSMDFSGVTNSLNGIEKSVNSMDFSGMEKALDFLGNRFSAKGEWIHNKIMGLINSVERKITALPSKALNQIKSGGWSRASNIAQAQFQIEGLKLSWDKLKKDIDYGVQDTAYGFDAAATAAAQLSASGIKAGDSMKAALRGISGVAAMANTSYESISRIYTQIAGSGRLYTNDLMQFSNHGLNVAATLGDQLNKTEAEIRDMVSKGQIDFKTFSKAMDDAYGTHAKEANKTFTGSLSNMKAALSRMGQPFAESIQNNAIPLFNKLKEVIVDVKERMEPLAKAFDWFMKGLTGAGVKILSSLKLDFFSGIFSKIGSAFQWLGDILNGFAGVVEPVKDAVDGVTEAVEPFLVTADEINEVANRIMKGDFGNGAENRFKAIQEELGWSEDAAKAAQNVVNEMMGSTFRYDVAADKMTKSVEGEGEALKKTGQLGNSYVAAHEKMKGTAKLVGESFTDMFKSIDKAEVLSKLGTFVRGLGAALSIFASITQSVVKGALSHLIDMLKSVGGFLLNAGEALGNWLTNLRAWVEESGALGKIQNFTSKAFGHVSNAVKTGLNVTSVGLKFVGTGLSKLKDGVIAGKEKIVEFFASFKNTEAYSRLFSVFQSIKDKFIEIKDNVIQKVMDLLDKFTGAKIKMPKIDMGNFAEKVSNKIVWLMDKVGALRDKLVSLFNEKVVGDWKIPEKLEGIKNAIMSVFTASTFEKIKGAFGSVVDTIGKFKDKIVSFFQDTVIGDWGLLDKLESLKEKIRELFSSETFASVKEFFTNIGEWFSGLFGGTDTKGAEAGLDAVETVVTKVDGVADKASHATQSFTVLKESFDEVLGTSENLADGAEKLTGKAAILDKFSKLVQWFKDKIDSIAGLLKSSSEKTGTISNSFGTIISGVLSAVSGVIGKGLPSLGNLLGTVVQTVADLFSSILPTMGNFISQIVHFVFDGGFASLIKTVQALVASRLAWNIASFAKSLSHALDSVGDVIAGIANIEQKISGVLQAVKKIGKATSRVMNAASILILAGAIAILAVAFKSLGSMSWEQFRVAAAAIAVITGALSVLFLVIGRFKSKGSGNVAQSALSPLFNVLDYLKSSIKKFMKRLGKAAMILAFVVAVKTLIGAVRSIGEMDPETAAKGLTGLGVLMGEFVVAMGALNLAMLPGGKAKFGSMIGQTVKMLGFVLVIKMLAKSVASLGTIDSSVLAKGTATVKALAISLDGMMIASHFMKSGKGNFSTLIGMAAIVATLALSLKALSKINGKSLRNATLALSAVEGVTASLAYIMSGFAAVSDSKQKLMSMITIVTIVGTLAFALYKLSSVDQTALAASGAVMTMVIAAIAALAQTMANLAEAGTIKDKLASVGVLALALAAVIGELGLATAAMQETNLDPTIMTRIAKDVGIMAMAMALIGFAIGQMTQSDMGAGEQFKHGLAAVGEGVVGIAALVAIEWLAGMLSNIDGFQTTLEKGRGVLKTIASTVGEILGSILTGIINAFKDALSDKEGTQAMTDNIGQFIEGVKTALSKAEGFSSEGIESMKEALTILVSIFGAEIINALIDSILGEDAMKDLIDKLTGFAKGMVAYSWIIAFMNVGAVTGSNTAAQLIVDLVNKVPKTGGFMQDLLGESEPGKYGEKLVPFAEGLVKYSWAIAFMNTGAVEASDAAANMVIGLSARVPKSGGFLQKVLGESEPGKYGEKLVPFAEGLVKYSWVISMMNTGAVESTNKAAEMVLKLAEKVPETGGILQDVMGEQNPGEYGRKLIPFAAGLVAYSWVIMGMNVAAVERTDKAAQMIMTLANSVPPDAGLFDILTGGTISIDTFGEDLITFAQGFAGFADEINKIEDSKVAKAKNTMEMVDMLVQFANDIVKDEHEMYTNVEWAGAQSIDTVGASYASFVNSLATALDDNGVSESMSGLGEQLRNHLMTGFTSVAEGGEGFGTIIGKAISEALAGESIEPDSLAPLADAIGTALKKAIDDGSKEVKAAGVNLIKDTFTDMTTSADTNGATLITKIAHVMDLIKEKVLGAYTNSFYNAMSNSLSGALRAGYDYVGLFKRMGRDLMTGLAEGISANGQTAINNAKNVADTIKATTATALQIKSPSRVFRRYGRYLMLGLGNGIKENADYAVNNAAAAAVGVVDITKEQLSEKNLREITGTLLAAYLYINQAINDAMDTNPVITPIVDLSQVQNGLNSMGGLFGGSSMSYARNMYPYSYVNGSIQQAGRDSVAAQLDGIRSDIRMLGEAMTGMQMVLDSGVVVGQLGTGIDQRLGDIQKVKERWG